MVKVLFLASLLLLSSFCSAIEVNTVEVRRGPFVSVNPTQTPYVVWSQNPTIVKGNPILMMVMVITRLGGPVGSRIIIDWGDGTPLEIRNNNVVSGLNDVTRFEYQHTYANAGSYNIKVTPLDAVSNTGVPVFLVNPRHRQGPVVVTNP